jgi:pimeloyl-ACP methyl ester carboxylesterase
MTKLVLLPGMDGTGDLFQPFLAEISPYFESIVVQYPLSAQLGYEGLIDLVRHELPTEDEFFILGESFSGPLAVLLAAQAAPNLRGLILCASFVRCPLPWAAMWRPLTHLLPFEVVPASILSLPLLGRFSHPRLRSLLSGALSKVRANVLRSRLRAVLSVDVREQLANVKVPLLYLQASADWVVPRSAAIEIAQAVQLLQVVELDGPHMLLQTSPVAAAQAVERFVSAAMLSEPLYGRKIDGQE